MSAPAPSKASIVLEWFLALLLAGNLWWTTLCLGGYRPETMVVTSSLNGLLLLAYLLGIVLGGAAGTRRDAWWLLPFLAYAAANVLWITPTRWLGWHDWLYWAQPIAVLWVALNGIRRPAPRTVLVLALVALAGVAVALGMHQRFVRPDWLMLGRTQAEQFIGRASGPFGIPNSLAALLNLLLPAMLATALCRRFALAWRLGAAAMAAALLLGLVLTISRGAWIAFAVACAVWPLVLPGRNWRWRVLASGGVVTSIALLGAGLYQGVPKVRERIGYLLRDRGELTRPILWRAAIEMTREQPWFGTGAGTYNVMFEKHRPEHFRDEAHWAHNEYLNTLSDYGVVGAGLFFGGALAMTAAALLARRRRPEGIPEGAVAGAAPPAWIEDPLVVSALGIGLLAFALQLSVDFLFKIPSLAMTAATLAACGLGGGGLGNPGAVPGRARRGLAVVGAGATVALMLGLVLPHYRAEAARYGARRDLDGMSQRPVRIERQRELVERARAAFARAVAIDPTNAQAWADRSYAETLWASFEPAQNRALGIEAEAAARRATELSPVVAEFWVRFGVGLDMQGRWIDAGDVFNRALILAPNSSSTWYYLGYHLSLRPATRGLAVSAIATSLRLDPANTAAEALRRRLAASP